MHPLAYYLLEEGARAFSTALLVWSNKPEPARQSCAPVVHCGEVPACPACNCGAPPLPAKEPIAPPGDWGWLVLCLVLVTVILVQWVVLCGGRRVSPKEREEVPAIEAEALRQVNVVRRR